MNAVVDPPPAQGGLRRLLRRSRSGGLTLADQLLSSLSNVLAVILVARALSAEDFGRFALGFSFLTLTLALSRCYLGTRVSLSPDTATSRRLAGLLMTGLLLASPLIALVVFAVSALASAGDSLGVLLIVAVTTPLVCVQDILRFGAVAGGRPWVAVVSDAVWVAAMAVPFVLQLSLTASQALSLWMTAALAATVLAVVLSRVRSPVRESWRELVRYDRMGASQAFGALVTGGGGLLVLVVVASSIGPGAVGSLRGASSAMGPVNVLLAFTGLGLTPILVRRARSADRTFSLLTGVVLAGATVLWVGALLLLPDDVGAAALGESWAGVRSVLPWTLVEYVLVGLGTGAVLGLKVRDRIRDLYVQRVVFSVVALVAGVLAAVFVRDVQWVAAGLALGALSFALVSWYQFVRSSASLLEQESRP